MSEKEKALAGLEFVRGDADLKKDFVLDQHLKQ